MTEPFTELRRVLKGIENCSLFAKRESESYRGNTGSRILYLPGLNVSRIRSGKYLLPTREL